MYVHMINMIEAQRKASMYEVMCLAYVHTQGGEEGSAKIQHHIDEMYRIAAGGAPKIS